MPVTWGRSDDAGLTAQVQALAVKQRNLVTMLKNFSNLSDPVATWASGHLMLESGNLNSPVSRNNINFGGIKYVGQPGASQGSKSPEGNYYARYPNERAFFKDYGRVLHLKPGIPANATSVDDFINRLYKNRYFTANPAAYAKALKSRMYTDAVKKIQAGNEVRIREVQDNQDTDIQAQKQQHQKFLEQEAKSATGWPWWDKQSLPVKVGLIAALAYVFAGKR